MNETLLLLPLTGVEWKGHRVSFGDPRARVEEVFGAPSEVKNALYYFASPLRFVETDAQELLNLLERENAGDVDDSEAGYCYAFRNISVGVWRETTPEDVEAMIASMRAVKDNVTALVSGDIAEAVEEERRRAGRWESIGIGRPDYYR